MKDVKLNYKQILTLVAGLFLFCNNAVPQAYTEFKKIERSYRANVSTMVDVTNKYGKIHVVNWTGDSVKIVASVSFSSPNNERSKLTKMLNTVDFSIVANSYYITANTIFGVDYTAFFDELKKLKAQVNIDYMIYVPSYINIKINNRFGDVYLGDYKGNINIKLAYGNLKAVSLNGETEITLESSKATIGNLTTGKINTSFGCELAIEKATQLDLTTIKSDIQIGDVNIMKIKSNRDIYKIAKVGYCYGETYFSELIISRLEFETNVNLKYYGSMKVESISKNFTFISIDSKYAEINFTFDSGASYQIDITHKNSTLVYPEKISSLDEKQLEGNKKQMLTYGRIGKTKTTAKVMINAESSKISIAHK